MAGTTGEFEGLADAQLVELACGGDRAAFGVLFARHRSLLRGLCTRALGDAALLNLGTLRRPERFGAWLGGIGLSVRAGSARTRAPQSRSSKSGSARRAR